MDSGLRRRMRRRIRDLNMSAPLSAEQFCRKLAVNRGRAIHLIPWDTTAATVPCGLWISTEQADFIVYEQATVKVLREHIILHEVGHLLLGHGGAGDLQDLAGTFDVLDSAVVERVLGRTSAYDAREEREAEVLASLIGEQLARCTPEVSRQLDVRDAAVIDRFSAALEVDRRWC